MEFITKINVGIADALASLCPNISFRTEDGIITWIDENPNPPTQEQIDAEIARLQAYYDNLEYQRKRAREYPPIGDQLDALWKGGEAAAEMLAKVQAVKNKYPKPE